MFENETKVNVETNSKAAKHISGKMKILVGAVACPFVFLVGVMLLLLEIFIFKEGNYFLSIFFMVFGAIMAAFMLLGYDKIMTHICKKSMQGKESTVKFIFKEEGYEAITTINDGTSGSTYGNYAAFMRCAEYADMWLLYINKATVFMVMKDSMTKGTAEELSEFLRVRVGKNYKVCYKKK